MKTSEFIEELREAMEIEDEEFTEETNLQGLEEYDSLSILSIIALIDENFDKLLVVDQLKSITTVKSLMELVGSEHFE